MTLRDVMETIKGAFEGFRASPFGWAIELLDILILAYFFYQLALLIKGTRAVQMMIGAVFVLGSYWLSGVLQFVTVHRFLGYLLYWIPFALIVIFQNTIRRVLTLFGHNPFSQRARAGRLEAPISEIVLAVTALAEKRIGGLIVIEREQGLRNFTETGIEIDAVVSKDLIVALFNPGSPTHDGAIVIQEGRIRAASCFLPLTVNPQLSKAFGSRHRAAIGLTEETDAICLAASEERGCVSAAFEGRIIESMTPGALRDFLFEHLGVGAPPHESGPAMTHAARRAGP
ncbi:MAG: TIGR00159 family protein [Acidobacteria bacterium]|nr:TIGR00159 family protein [Acidobacteriota bacterium]